LIFKESCLRACIKNRSHDEIMGLFIRDSVLCCCGHFLSQTGYHKPVNYFTVFWDHDRSFKKTMILIELRRLQ
jgi:hypothetical protein